jgi:ATP phosphoribosyltransferase regulatory subunit
MTVKEHQDRLLQIPLGTESFFLEEAYRHREITYKLHRLFVSWGYLPAETPVFDFFDTYRELLRGNKKQIYRLIDREGDLLMLRSDITLFLAKQMGLILRDEDLPARICYSDTILRHQNREDISKNEFFQVGAELIGKEKIEGDLEILLLMIEMFSCLDIEPTIHLGSRRLVDAVFASLNDNDKEAAIASVRNRNRAETIKVLEKLYGESLGNDIAALLRFIGTGEEFRDKKSRYSSFLDKEASAALDELDKILDVMQKLGKDQLFRIDFSEAGEQPYYTGIVFQAYLQNLDSAVASGGRYDKLLAGFGYDAPSAGFMVMLRKIEPFLADAFHPPELKEIDHGEVFEERYKRACKARAEGRSVTL